MIPEKCIKCGNRIGLISVIVSLFLGIFKFTIGIMSGSHALMANAFYSIQDILSSIVIMWSSWYSRKKPTVNYPYGYGKVEFIAITALSLFIIISVIIIIFFAGLNVFSSPKRPGITAIWGVLISFLATYFLSIYLKCSGKKLESPAILSNAQHVHMDMISAACVGIGIIITIAGFNHLDSIIAVFEAIHIMFTSIEILRNGINGLMDSSLSPHDVNAIEKEIEMVSGVKNVVSLKTRAIGREKQIDCEIEVEGDLSLDSVAELKSEIKCSVRKRYPTASIINVAFTSHVKEISGRHETIKIAKILNPFYCNFIGKHELNVLDNELQLILYFLPGILLNSCEIIKQIVENKLSQEFKDRKYIVIINRIEESIAL